jgi:hypothetical protein
MGLVRFNANTSSSNGALLYRMKPVTTTSQLYGQGHGIGDLPVVRSGAPDKAFWATANTGINLSTTNSAGIATTTAAITYTTYLASSTAKAFHLNSVDGCLYILIGDGAQVRLIKVNDSTGAVTTIGAAFTPTTVNNWAGTMEVDSGSGHLKIMFNGFYHLVDKSSGAVVSQDTVVTLGSFLARKVCYVTQDGTTGLTSEYANAAADGFRTLPTTIHSSYGSIGTYPLSAPDIGGVISAVGTGHIFRPDVEIHLVDSNKVAICSLTAVNTLGAKIYLRTDFDKLIKSIAELGAGVI